MKIISCRIVKEIINGLDIYYPEIKFILLPIWCRFDYKYGGAVFFNTMDSALNFLIEKNYIIKKVKREIFELK